MRSWWSLICTCSLFLTCCLLCAVWPSCTILGSLSLGKSLHIVFLNSLAWPVRWACFSICFLSFSDTQQFRFRPSMLCCFCPGFTAPFFPPHHFHCFFVMVRLLWQANSQENTLTLWCFIFLWLLSNPMSWCCCVHATQVPESGPLHQWRLLTFIWVVPLDVFVKPKSSNCWKSLPKKMREINLWGVATEGNWAQGCRRICNSASSHCAAAEDNTTLGPVVDVVLLLR